MRQVPLEYLDVLDEKGNPTGEVRDYFEVHEKGSIHKVAHIYILNSKGELLLQQRNHDRRAFPNYWDISSAGHVSSAQTSIQAAQRETFEELGLSIPLEVFKYFHSGEEHLVLDDGKYINNEFQDAFIVQLDIENPEIKIDKSEVANTKWISIPDFQKKIVDLNFLLVPHDVEFIKFLEYIEK